MANLGAAGVGDWRSLAGAAAQGLCIGYGGICSECVVRSAGLRTSVVGSAASATTLGLVRQRTWLNDRCSATGLHGGLADGLMIFFCFFL